MILPDSFWNAWDTLRVATQEVECALPSQMTEKMAKLIEARSAFDQMIRDVSRPASGADAPDMGESRYHLVDGGVRIQTTDGEIEFGKGWLLISEQEYERMTNS